VSDVSGDRNRRERELILARRRFFVASALASVGVVGACQPQPCLNVAEPPRSEAGPDPSVPDETPPDEGQPDAGESPQVCLSVPQAKPKSPPPHVCLEFAEPPDDT
jgi:hypothetical protein